MQVSEKWNDTGFPVLSQPIVFNNQRMTFTSGILICTYNGVPERWFISVIYSLQKTFSYTSSSCLLDMEHLHHIRATYPVAKDSGLSFIHKRPWIVERSKYVFFKGDIIISLSN